ncbi:MAG: ferredoxin-thioredoxin reductase variable chain [Phormidium sp.]
MKIGDRIRVKQSVIVYHHPQHRGKPFDINGLSGEIVAIIHEWQGRPVSANFPVQVKFDKKFKAHFRENEVEIVD